TTQRGDLRQAVAFMEKALQINQESPGSGSAEAALNLLNMGTLYLRLGDEDRAEPLMRQGLKLCRNATMDPSQWAGDEQILQRGKKLRRSPSDGPSVAYAQALGRLAHLRYFQRDWPHAELLHRRALGLCQSWLPDGHPMCREQLGLLAGDCVAMGE